MGDTLFDELKNLTAVNFAQLGRAVMLFKENQEYNKTYGRTEQFTGKIVIPKGNNNRGFRFIEIMTPKRFEGIQVFWPYPSTLSVASSVLEALKEGKAEINKYPDLKEGQLVKFYVAIGITAYQLELA